MGTYSGVAFRRTAVRYTAGRLINAAIGLLVFIWIARLLPPDDYAVYVTAFAIMELALVIFTFGMEWVTTVQVPAVRLNSNGRALARFVTQCFGIQALSLAFGAVVLYCVAPILASALSVPSSEWVIRLYAVVMFAEGLGRVVRDQLLSSLLLNGAAQLSQSIRNFGMLGFALALHHIPEWRRAETLATAEALASSASLLISGGLLTLALWQSRGISTTTPDWTPPPWRELFATAGNAWVSNLSNLAWGGQVVILLAARYLGAELTAAVGFARNLAEQVRRYLPMEFMFGLARTLVIARFVEESDSERLGQRAGLLFRINLIFVMPLLCVAIVSGEQVCTWLSQGKYPSAHWYLVGWLAVLTAWTHHRATDLMANALGRSRLCRGSSLRLLVVPPLLIIAASWQQWNLLFLILAAAELTYSILVLVPMAIYRLNLVATSKIIGIGAMLIAILLIIPIPAGGLGVAIHVLLGYGLMLTLGTLLAVWTRADLSLIYALKVKT